MRRAAAFSVAGHALALLLLVAAGLLSAPRIDGLPIFAEVELVEQNTPTVGAARPAQTERTPAETAAPAATKVPLGRSETTRTALPNLMRHGVEQQATAAPLPLPPPPAPPPPAPSAALSAPPAAPSPALAATALARGAIASAHPSHSSSLFSRAIQTSGDSASGHRDGSVSRRAIQTSGDAASGHRALAGTGLVSGAHVIPAAIDKGVRNVPPAYPRDAVRNGEEGVVLLKIHVAADGAASAVDVASSSGYALLDEAARKAVARWHFVPARRSGDPVPSTMLVRIRFVLKNAGSPQ